MLLFLIAFILVPQLICVPDIPLNGSDFELLNFELNLIQSDTVCPFTVDDALCSNDDTCTIYGNCCPKKILDYIQNSTIPQEPDRLPPHQCRPLNHKVDTYWVYMETDCPESWQDFEVLLRCKKIVLSTSYTYILDIPVFSNASGTVYTNIYCAACNNDSMSIAPTELKFWCDPWTPQCYLQLQQAQYNPGKLEWQGNVSMIRAEINEIPSAKRCHKFVDNCDSNIHSIETTPQQHYRKFCNMYRDPVQILSQFCPCYLVEYKNVYCALCNDILVDLGSCNKILNFPFLTNQGSYNPLFYTIINFNSDDKFKAETVCGAGRLYDVIGETCIDFFCDENYHMDRDSRCKMKPIFPEIPGEKEVHDEHQLLEKIMKETSCYHSDCSMACSCHHSCFVYGDCCHNIALNYLRILTLSPESIISTPKSWQCTQIPGQMDKSPVYQITTCPSEWEDAKVSLRCSKSDLLSNYTHILDVPVFSEDSDTLYANMYCAMCHNDTRKIAPTPLDIECNPSIYRCKQLLQTAQYQPGKLQWQVANISITASLPIYHSARKCHQYIDHCGPNTTIYETPEHKAYQKLCYMYKNPVWLSPDKFLGSKGMYKNIHCAACNGIPIDTSACYMTYKFLSLDLFRYLKDNEKNLDDLVYHDIKTPFHSLGKILDFGGAGDVGEEAICGPGQIYDYDADDESCIDYVCGKNYEVGPDGTCIRKSALFNITNGGLNDSCIMIALSSSEYSYLNASVIRVNRTNDENFFETDLFEETDNGTVLICSPETVTAYTNKFSAAQGLLTFICLTISLICLAVHILVYIFVAKLRNLPGKNLLSLSCSIFVAQLLFLSGRHMERSYGLCVATGAMTHFAYLATFFWMNVIAYDMCRTFASKTTYRTSLEEQGHKFARYSAYGWISPGLLVATALILDATAVMPDLSPRYAQPHCWINSRKSLTIFLALPLLLLLVANIICFTMIAYTIKKVTAEASVAVKGSTKSERTRFYLYVKLALILGLAWILGFVAAWANVEVLWYLYIIFNSLQGAFIFFAFTFKRKILTMIMDKLPIEITVTRKKETKDLDTTQTNVRTSTDENSPH